MITAARDRRVATAGAEPETGTAESPLGGQQTDTLGRHHRPEVTDDARPETDAESTQPPPDDAQYTRVLGRSWLTLFGVAAFVAFVVVKLGPSLVGAQVFAATGALARWSPWADGSPLPRLNLPPIGDSLDAALPGYV